MAVVGGFWLWLIRPPMSVIIAIACMLVLTLRIVADSARLLHQS